MDKLIPETKKPLLYLYDPYQTYDLIEWGKITSYWSNVKSAHSLFEFFDLKDYFKQNHIFLIDRFTPWGYKWCDEYSTKIYHFINYFTGTDYYESNLPEICGCAFPFSNRGIPINYDSLIDSSKYLNRDKEYIPFEIPANKDSESVIITWLEYDNIDLNSSALNQELEAILVKRYKAFYSDSKNVIKGRIYIGNIAPCSIVVSSSNDNLKSSVEQYFTKQKGLLYSNLDGILAEITQSIEKAIPYLFDILNSLSYSIDLNIKMEGSLIGGTGKFPYYRSDFNNGGYGMPATTQSTFRKRPEYYRNACLLYANNDYWKNGQQHNDLGKKPTFYKKRIILEN